MDKKARKSVQDVLRRRHQARENRGYLYHDYNGCEPGEIFFQNMSESAFEQLPFTTKRRGEPARTVDGQLYEKLYGDKESFAVYVQTSELEALGIRYKWRVKPMCRKTRL